MRLPTLLECAVGAAIVAAGVGTPVSSSAQEISFEGDLPRMMVFIQEEGRGKVASRGIAARLGDHERAAALLDQAREEGMYWTELHPVFHLYDAMSEYEPFLQAMSPRG